MRFLTGITAFALVGLAACDKGSPWPNYGGDPQGRWEGLTQASATVSSHWTRTTAELRLSGLRSCPTINRANQMVVPLISGDIVAIDPLTHNVTGIDHVSEIVRTAVNMYQDRPLISASGGATGSNLVKSLGAGGWATPVIDLPSVPVSNGDQVFVSANRFVYALDRATGAIVHQTNVGDEIASVAGPALAPEPDLAVLVATLNGNIVKLDPATGTIKWRKAFPGTHFNNGVSIALNGTIFVRSHEGSLLVLDPSGNLKGTPFNSGTANVTAAGRLYGPAVATFGGSAVAYVADGNRKLTAISDQGAILWQRDLPDAPVSNPIAAGDTVYVAVGGSPNTKLLAVTKDAVRWSVTVGYPPCLAAGRDGYIYATSGGNRLHMIKIG